MNIYINSPMTCDSDRCCYKLTRCQTSEELYWVISYDLNKEEIQKLPILDLSNRGWKVFYESRIGRLFKDGDI